MKIKQNKTRLVLKYYSQKENKKRREFFIPD